jgi:hypothetical protein
MINRAVCLNDCEKRVGIAAHLTYNGITKYDTDKPYGGIK